MNGNNPTLPKAILDQIVEVAARTAVQESKQIDVAEIARLAVAEYENAILVIRERHSKDSGH